MGLYQDEKKDARVKAGQAELLEVASIVKPVGYGQAPQPWNLPQVASWIESSFSPDFPGLVDAKLGDAAWPRFQDFCRGPDGWAGPQSRVIAWWTYLPLKTILETVRFVTSRPESIRSHDSFHPESHPRIPIPVVCAVVFDAGGRVLLAQRPAHKHLGLKWEFPGGKVEPNENPEHALRREIKEELGCDLDEIRPLPRFTHDYGTVVIEMIPYTCKLSANSTPPHPHEHIALAWAGLADLKTYDLAPADWPVLAALT
jgi:8-oxo-dGTP diphosphatase